MIHAPARLGRQGGIPDGLDGAPEPLALFGLQMRLLALPAQHQPQTDRRPGRAGMVVHVLQHPARRERGGPDADLGLDATAAAAVLGGGAAGV